MPGMFESIVPVVDAVTKLLTAIGAIGALILAILNRKKLTAIHIQWNSKLDQLVKTSGQLKHAEGFEEGRQAQITEEGNNAEQRTRDGGKLPPKPEN